MTKVTFENATIRDVIGKAARVAPAKGAAFDKASGIVIDVNASTGEITVRSTNLDVYYTEITDAISVEGDSVSWRVLSNFIDGICSKLPITSGSTVTFDDSNGNQLKIATGRMRATLGLLSMEYYPNWDTFDPELLSPVSNFAGRLQQVQWAASKTGTPPLTGIHLNGTHAVATDRFRIALTPCEIPQLLEPVTIPASIFTPLMKNLGEVKIGQDGSNLLVMPDNSTQIRAVIFDGNYPNIPRSFKRDETDAMMLKKSALLEIIERAEVMGQQERNPLLKMIVGLGEVAVLMEDQEIGLLGDVLELPGQAPHDRHYIGFTPNNLKQGLQAAPNEDISFYYHYGMPMKPVRLDGGSGYEVLIMPRNLERSNNEA